METQNLQIDAVAEQLEGYTAADITNVCRYVKLLGIISNICCVIGLTVVKAKVVTSYISVRLTKRHELLGLSFLQSETA